jgi:hypothetical protein
LLHLVQLFKFISSCFHSFDHSQKEIAKTLQMAEEARNMAQRANHKAAEAQKLVLLLRHESMEKNQRVEEIELDAAKEASMAQAQPDSNKQHEDTSVGDDGGGNDYFGQQQQSNSNGGGGSYYGEQAQPEKTFGGGEANSHQNGTNSWGDNNGATGFGIMGGGGGDGMEFASPWGDMSGGGHQQQSEQAIASPPRTNNASDSFPF